MSDIKLFIYNDQGAQELKGKSALVEKHIQRSKSSRVRGEGSTQR
jgi:hypothetical protein